MGADLSELEALVRLAILVARADGVEAATERARASQLLASRLDGHDDARLERLVTTALDDVATTPTPEILGRLGRAFPRRDAAMEAMHIACQIAIADSRLAWQESRQVLDLADAFGLTADDVRAVLHTYWPVRTRRRVPA